MFNRGSNIEEEAMIVAFRKHTLLPYVDCTIFTHSANVLRRHPLDNLLFARLSLFQFHLSEIYHIFVNFQKGLMHSSP